MTITFYCYPKCGTCRKAKKWFEQNQISFEEINLVEQPPTKEQLAKWIKQSGLPIKRFFNTSGQKYRELGLKDKLDQVSDDQKLEWLASDGMLIKRPLTLNSEQITVGFKEDQFEEAWK